MTRVIMEAIYFNPTPAADDAQATRAHWKDASDGHSRGRLRGESMPVFIRVRPCGA